MEEPTIEAKLVLRMFSQSDEDGGHQLNNSSC